MAPPPNAGLDRLFDPRRSSQSGSLVHREYWWYRARRRLLQTVAEHRIPPGGRILEVGSADGPSVGWMTNLGDYIPTDVDPRGLAPGGVCATATRLPLRDEAVNVVAAFDVIEHIPDEDAVLRELHRVLVPGGLLLVSVPAYNWAWSEADVAAGHHRRYTRGRLVAALRRHGFDVERATYIFMASFPAFAADRLLSRFSGREPEQVATSDLPSWQRSLLLALGAFDERLVRRWDLPFGSSVVACARRR